jgi:hypothetical protein
MSELKEIEPEWLTGVAGGRASSSSQEELKTMVKATGDAVKDLVRQQADTSSSSQMMPMMMMLMMRR